MSVKVFERHVILFAEVMIPSLYKNQAQQSVFLKNINQIINNLDSESISKIKLLVSLIGYLSYCYYLKSFAKLSYKKRQNFIDNLFNFKVKKIVAGLTGLRSLSLVAYYSLESTWTQINYNRQ